MANATFTATFSTAGTYTWTDPTGITSALVWCWAGGAGGTAGGASNTGGTGGGAGEFAGNNALSVTPATAYTIVVGAGGSGGVWGGAASTSGGVSSFSPAGVTAHGGSHGTVGTQTAPAGGTGSGAAIHHDGGAGGSTSGTTFRGAGGGGGAGSGGVGSAGQANSNNPALGGSGGTPDGGTGATGALNSTPAVTASAPGGGGGGGYGGNGAGSEGSGSNGAAGQAVVSWSMATGVALTASTSGGVYTWTAPAGATLATWTITGTASFDGNTSSGSETVTPGNTYTFSVGSSGSLTINWGVPGTGSSGLNLTSTGAARTGKFGPGSSGLKLASTGAAVLGKPGTGSSGLLLASTGTGASHGAAGGASLLSLTSTGTAIVHDLAGGASGLKLTSAAAALIGKPGAGASGLTLTSAGAARIGPRATGASGLKLASTGTAIVHDLAAGTSGLKLSSAGAAITGKHGTGSGVLTLTSTGTGSIPAPRSLLVAIASQAGIDDYGTAFPAGLFSASGVILLYNGTPATGTLFYSNSPAGGTDAYGNAYPQGEAYYGISGLTSLFTIEDGSGNTLAAIDSGGNITGQTISATDDVNIAGSSFLDDYLPPLSEGVIFRTNVLYQQSRPFPSSPTSSEVVLYELDVNLTAGRDYTFHIAPILVNLNGPGQAQLTIYYTSDGSTPTTSSSIWARNLADVAGSNSTLPISVSLNMEYSPALNKTYRFIVSLATNGTGSGTPTWQIPSSGGIGVNLGAMWVVDGGSTVGDTGLWIGSGSSGGGGGSPQTFTKTYTAAHTYAYEGTNADSNPNPGFTPGAKINTDGKAYQGDDQLGDNGNTSTMITWPGSVVSDLSGATVNWITITLNNNHSWFNSGMTIHVGKHNGSAGGSTRPTYTDPDLIQHSVNEGATITFSLSGALSAFTAALQGGQPFVLYNPTSTRFSYGYFGGASQTGPPKITVNYTTS